MAISKELIEKVKDLVEEAVAKLKENPELLERFEKEPVKVLEEILKIDLPDDQVQAVIDGIKTKLDIDDLKENLGNIAGKLKGLGSLFGKK